jgi:hypothetical protein
MSIDLHKSFFNIIDSVPRVGTRAVADLTAGFEYLQVGNKTRRIARAENHFINAIGFFRVIMNGTVVEEWTNNIGELDAILKRLNYSESYNILQDHQNFNRTYTERYAEANVTKREYQIVPEFSKFWRTTEPISGGIELQIEIIIHPDYLKRVLDCGHGDLPFLTSAGGAVVTAALTDRLTTTPAITSDSYVLHSIDLFLWVEQYSNVAPIMAPLTYNHESWKIERRNLANAQDHYFELVVGSGVKQFGFVFQNATQDFNIGVGNFSGAPTYTRGASGIEFLSTADYYLIANQSKELATYEIEYGKNRLPYYPLNLKFDPTGISDNSTKIQSYIRQLAYGNLYDMSGTHTFNSEFQTRKGPIYLEKFYDHNDSDQTMIKLRLFFSVPVTNLCMYYFYQHDTNTTLSYDGSGNAVQIIPNN